MSTAAAKKIAPPVMHIVLCDRRGSGFIKDGTRGKDYEEELDAPVARFIPNFGYRRGTITETVEGREVVTEFNEPIRYIKEQREISDAKLKLMGIAPRRASKEDKIILERGKLSVVREGSFVSLFDYLKSVYYNKTNPLRSSAAQAIFEEVIAGKEEEESNENEFLIAEAFNYLKKLQVKKGEKQFSYNEEKLTALCGLFGLYAETPAGKMRGLMDIAKLDPEDFMQQVTRLDQRIVSEINQALELNVLQLKGNSVEYVNKEKIVTDLGPDKMSRAKQIEKLADLMITADFAEAYQEMIQETEIAKEKQLSK